MQKILSILLVCVICFSMAACGKNPPEKNQSTSNKTSINKSEPSPTELLPTESLSIEPLETQIVEAQYRIVRWDRSVIKNTGESSENYYYDYLELQGDSPSFQKINDTLYSRAEKYMYQYSDGETLASYGGSYTGYSHANTTVKYNDNGFLCVMLDSNSYTGGGRDYTYYVQLCFDLNTGEIVTLPEITGLNEKEFLSEFRKISYEQAQIAYGGIMHENAESIINNWDLEDFQYMFYIEKDGEIWLNIPAYELSNGMAGERAIPTGYSVSGSTAQDKPNNVTPIDTDLDGYPDNVDLNPTVPYRTPIILLHGRVSNTAIFYGVTTNIGINPDDPEKKENNQYDAVMTADGDLYTSPEAHKIISIEDGKLGDYLVDMGYKPNKTLFAFNYPNEDMVQYNATKLQDYIQTLLVWASESDDSIVDSKYLYPTQKDKDDQNVKFILIGHSMGGLVSRYYIENLNSPYVDKLITICTPHYGTDFAKQANHNGAFFISKPCDIDLMSDAWLYTGRRKDISYEGQIDDEMRYGSRNQSTPLKGNQNIDVKYYAIGGYAIDNLYEDGLAEQLDDIISDGGALLVEFTRDLRSQQTFNDSINNSLDALSLTQFGQTSFLTLGNRDGDNIVDYASQFAVRFNDTGTISDSQRLEDQVMILMKDEVFTFVHNRIAEEPLMYGAVQRFVEASSEAPTIIDSGNCNENINWTLDSNGTLTVSGSGEMPDYGKEIGVHDQPWYPYCNGIQKVVVSHGITELGWYNFAHCDNLTQVEIANSVTHLGFGTFVSCDNLRKIVIPDSVTAIGWDVFFECKELTHVTLPSNLQQLGYHVFFQCTSLETITIPASVDEIGMNCFKGCSNLKSVYFLGAVPQFLSGEFYETHRNLILYYIRGSQGWTKSSWTAPDGTVYHTDTFEP